MKLEGYLIDGRFYRHDQIEGMTFSEDVKVSPLFSDPHSVLNLAGKLATAARLVVYASVKGISQKVEELENAVDEYDNEVMK